jgi:hypothetical protein
MNRMIIETFGLLELCLLMSLYSAFMGSAAGFLMFTFMCPILFVSERWKS